MVLATATTELLVEVIHEVIQPVVVCLAGATPDCGRMIAMSGLVDLVCVDRVPLMVSGRQELCGLKQHLHVLVAVVLCGELRVVVKIEDVDGITPVKT